MYFQGRLVRQTKTNRQITITLPNTTAATSTKNTQKQLTAASTPTRTTQLQATAHTPTNTTQKQTAPRPTQTTQLQATAHTPTNYTQKQTAPRPTQITQKTTAPRPTQTPQQETPAQRQTQTTEQQPSIVMLNAINLNIEKLIRRQIDFEMCVTRKLDSTIKRIFGIESSLTKMVERLDELKTNGDGGLNESISLEETDVSDEMFGDIPDRYRFSVERLRELRNDSTGIGNFGLTLTREFFPELFGPGNHRWKSSWFGGGVKSKNELDPLRKEIIRRYVTAFHPAAGKTSVWKDTIVTRINEGLRRKEDKEGTSRKGRVEATNVTQRASVDVGLQYSTCVA